MDNNRYAPPLAVNRDVVEEVALPRPIQVLWAVRLLGASTLITSVQSCVEAAGAQSGLAMIGSLTFEAALAAFWCYLYVCIYRGRNWARIITLVFAVLELFALAIGFFEPVLLGSSNFYRLVGVLSSGCDIASMWLLFAPPGSAWFKKHAIG